MKAAVGMAVANKDLHGFVDKVLPSDESIARYDVSYLLGETHPDTQQPRYS